MILFINIQFLREVYIVYFEFNYAFILKEVKMEKSIFFIYLFYLDIFIK